MQIRLEHLYRHATTSTAASVIPEHGTVLQLKRKVKGVGKKLFIESYFHHLKSLWIYTRRK
jgi:hypothetical protein